MNSLSEPVRKRDKILGEKICAALEAKGFKKALYVETAQEATTVILDMIASGESVGVPGTVSVRELNLIDGLAGKGCKIHQHWDPNLKKEERPQRFIDENCADWFITSVNGMAYDGTMINIDGTGNRVAGMAWGPGKLLVIAGVNKLAPDFKGAMDRARGSSAPNALRIGTTPPCTKAGRCVNCDAPERICRVVTIMERAPFGRECYFVLVGESLGF